MSTKTDNTSRQKSVIISEQKPIKSGICFYDTEELICSWNQSAQSILTYTQEDVIGKPIWFIFPMIRDLESAGVYNIMAGNYEMKSLYIEKSTMTLPEGKAIYVVSFSDQTDYMNKPISSVGELHKDEQSGLYDHTSIIDILTQEAKRAIRYKQPLTVMGILIDRYKSLVESQGLDNLDLIVQTLAIILKNETRDVDSIGRLSQDLFVICLPNTHLKAAQIVENRINKVTLRHSNEETPFKIKTTRMGVTESVVHWQKELETLLGESKVTNEL